MIFANIDGKWHKEVQSADGLIATDCGLEIPMFSEWTRDEPTKDRCADCFDLPQKQTPKKKAA